jgi:hypothetical protein
MVDALIDLRSEFGPARDQGHRYTCLAFAASDTHAALRSGWQPLSCEYAFFKAQKRAARPPTRGAVLNHMLDAIRLDGQPAETQWPYSPVDPDPWEWAPPPRVDPLYARNGSAHHKDVSWLIKVLDQGTPAIVLMMLSASFYAKQPGNLIDEAPNEKADSSIRHAVIAVGHGTTGSQRAVLVRNSWGSSWGNGGYAWLTERYLAARMFAAALLLEDVSVSSSSAAA